MHTRRQQEIIEAALELINEKGIQGLTIKNLSHKIGISEPAIYRHFENKIQILSAVMDSFQTRSMQLFSKHQNGEFLAKDEIKGIFSGHFKILAEKPALSSVIFSEEIFRNEPELVDKINQIITRNQEKLKNIIEQGQKAGQLKQDIEPEYLAIIVLGTLRLFVKNWQFSKFSFDLEKEGAQIIQSVIQLIAV